MILENKKVRKILVLNLGGIGDVLLSTPALRALKRLYPEAHLAFLGVPRTRECAENFKIFNEVLSLDSFDEQSRKFFIGDLLKIFKILLYLKKQRFDMIINMRTLVSWMGSLKMACLFFIITAPYRVGRDTEGRGFFLNIKIKENDAGERHEMEYDLETVKALGADISERVFNADLLGFAEIDGILEKEGLNKFDSLIAINPGGMSTRRWPVENFIKTIEYFLKTYDCKIVITGGASEVALNKGINQHFNEKVVDLTNRLNLAELAALLKRCRLFITNDTGPMHVAAILKIPLIAIFGSGFLTRFDPRRISEKSIVLYQRIECAPCNKVECKSLKCLKKIEVQDVLEAARKVLE